MLNSNKVGLALGFYFAIVHAAWQALVWMGYAGKFITWILSLHSISMPLTVTAFSIATAITLVIATFILGYIFGWVFALVWNRVRK